MDPNAVVGADYQLNLITKRDGTVISGMLDKETATALVVRTMTETVTIPKTEIKAREVTPQSLMPPGLLEALPEREAVELLKFLTTEGKYSAASRFSVNREALRRERTGAQVADGAR